MLVTLQILCQAVVPGVHNRTHCVRLVQPMHQAKLAIIKELLLFNDNDENGHLNLTRLEMCGKV